MEILSGCFAQIEVIDNEVCPEEFSDWEDSKRRIDLLALDKQANLVVIELKRTSDGGHMELQAVRYASMISSMTFEQAVRVHEAFLTQMDESPETAQARILDFLDWDDQTKIRSQTMFESSLFLRTSEKS